MVKTWKSLAWDRFKIIPMTIRPSPDPMSRSFPLEPARNSFKTFANCVFVAGTNGKQNFRNAGDTNGIQITEVKIAAPPACVQIERETVNFRETHYEFWSNVSIFMLHIPDKAIRIFPPVDSFLFAWVTFCDAKLCSSSLCTDVILRLDSPCSAIIHHNWMQWQTIVLVQLKTTQPFHQFHHIYLNSRRIDYNS